MATTTSFLSEETFTQEGFRRWLESCAPSDVRRYELIRGRIVMSPPAGGRHAQAGAELLGLLREHVKASRLGLLFDSSAGFELPSGDTLEPDVAFVSRERWDAGPRPAGNEFVRIVPSLVVEVLSPTTARRDRTEKLEIYAQNGVEEYWLVDVVRRAVIVYARAGSVFGAPEAVTSGLIRSVLLSGLRVRVEDVFVDFD